MQISKSACSVWFLAVERALLCMLYQFESILLVQATATTTPTTPPPIAATTTTPLPLPLPLLPAVLESQPFGYVNHYMICRDFDWDTSDPNRNPGFTGLVFEIPLKHQISWISAKGWNKRAFVDNAANHERILWSQAPRHLARSKGHLQQSQLGFPVDIYQSINWIITPTAHAPVTLATKSSFKRTIAWPHTVGQLEWMTNFISYQLSLRLTFPVLKSLQNGTLLCVCLSTGGTSATCGLRKTSRRVKGLPMPVISSMQESTRIDPMKTRMQIEKLKPLF